MFFHTHNSNPCHLLGESAVPSTEQNVYYIYAEKDKACQYISNVFICHSLSLAGAATSIIFVATKVLYFVCHICRDKPMSRQNTSFIATKVCLSRQIHVCCF